MCSDFGHSCQVPYALIVPTAFPAGAAASSPLRTHSNSTPPAVSSAPSPPQPCPSPLRRTTTPHGPQGAASLGTFRVSAAACKREAWHAVLCWAHRVRIIHVPILTHVPIVGWESLLTARPSLPSPPPRELERHRHVDQHGRPVRAHLLLPQALLHRQHGLRRGAPSRGLLPRRHAGLPQQRRGAARQLAQQHPLCQHQGGCRGGGQGCCGVQELNRGQGLETLPTSFLQALR